MILRRIARPMLAAMFVSGGIETLRNPKPPIQAAEPVLDKAVGKVEHKLPDQLPTDAESLVKLDAMIKIGAGLALAFNKAPRLASLLLAGTLVPTTVVAHRFWECTDPQERAQQQVHFFKNVSLFGGLLIASADTHGKPSLGWRARRAARLAGGTVHRTSDTVQGKVLHVTDAVQGSLQSAAGAVQGTTQSVAGAVQGTAKSVAGAVQGAAQSSAGAVQDALHSAAGAGKHAAGTVQGKAKSLLPR